MITTLQELETKIVDDEANMRRALPSSPREDDYYQKLGEDTNLIAGDYADKHLAINGVSTIAVRQYLLNLYKLDSNISAALVTSLASDAEAMK